MTEPHPQRCETCGNHKCEFHKSNPTNEYMGSPISTIIWIFTREKGCANHSSTKSESEALLEELTTHFEEFKDQRTFKYSASDIIQYLVNFKKLVELRQQKEREP